MKGAVETGVLVLLAALVGVAALNRSRAQDAETEGDAVAQDTFSSDAEEDESVVPAAPSLAWNSVVDGLPTVGQWRGKPALADVDGDGDLDLIASMRRLTRSAPGEGLFVWLQGEEAGTPWELGIAGLRRDMGYGGAATGDFDEDGLVDLAFSGHDVPPHVFFGDGRGGWPRSTSLETKMTSDLCVGDFDGDGHQDIATVPFVVKQGGLRVFFGDGTGAFPESIELLDRHRFGAYLEAEDLEGDGSLELLAATSVGPRVWGFDGRTAKDRSRGLLIPKNGGVDRGIRARDLDADGTKELIVCGMMDADHEPLSVYRLEDGTWVETDAGLPGDEAVFDIAFVRDGDTSLLAAAGKYGISVYAMPEPLRFERVGRLSDTGGVLNLCAGDVTGDGRDELVAVGHGGVRVLSIDPQGAPR